MIDAQSFKNAMRLFASGITVITWKEELQVQGITVSAFSSLSLNPPLVLFCIDHGAYVHPLLCARAFVVINILSAEQEKLAYQFAGADRSGLDPHIIYTNDKSEAMLADAQANLLVKIRDRIRQGDHDIFIATVDETRLNPERRPLLYHNGRMFS